MRQRKQARLQPFRDELEAGGVEYKPITFSCYGRPHPDALRLMRAFGRRLARRKGTEEHCEVRHLASCVGVELWRRAARMVRQCLPEACEEEADETHQPLEPEVLLRDGPPGTVDPPPFA